MLSSPTVPGGLWCWDPVLQSLGPVLGSLGRAGWTPEVSELVQVPAGIGVRWGCCLRGENHLQSMHLGALD